MNFHALVELDRSLSSRLRVKPDKGWLWNLSAFLAHSGDSWFWFGGLIIAWLFTRGSWRVTAAMLAGGITALAVLVLLVKFRIRRPRPAGEWGAIYRSTDPHSFPSGHAARSVLLAVMALSLGPPWFGFLILAWAPLVSLARVAMGVHYLSDVLAGFLIGLMMAMIMLLVQPLLLAFLPFLFYSRNRSHSLRLAPVNVSGSDH
jgi:undecaprenyl-diphosphatase